MLLEYGPGVSEIDIRNVAEGLNERGCLTILEQGLLPEMVLTSVGDVSLIFDEPVNAGGWALSRCLPE